jgi:hypothetical protein
MRLGSPGPGDRRQEVCQSGLPHPVAQLQGIAASNQQGVAPLLHLPKIDRKLLTLLIKVASLEP